jgi:hypothetical protein
MGDHGGAQRFGHRRQLEDGVGADLVGLAVPGTVVFDPEPLGVDRLSTVHHGHGQTGNAGFPHQVVGDAVEFADGVLDSLVGQRHCGHQRWWYIRQ